MSDLKKLRKMVEEYWSSLIGGTPYFEEHCAVYKILSEIVDHLETLPNAKESGDLEEELRDLSETDTSDG